MTNRERIPVVILNGFLGSGKTTLFRNLINQSKAKDISLSAIVNDMSELDVDGEILGLSNVVENDSDILESISSCVLSSEKGITQLNESIHRLRINQSPDIIVIETSGSCHPMPLIEYFKSQLEFKLIGVLVLVDSLMLSHDFNYGQMLIPLFKKNLSENKRDTINLMVEQIMFCSHLFLTKSDRIEKSRLSDIATHIQSINPKASVHNVLFGRLDIQSLFELSEYNYINVAQLINELRPVLKLEQVTERPFGLGTKVIKDDRPFHPERLWDVCHNYLGKHIYRSKGFFWMASRRKYSLLWNQAAGGISLELIGTWKAAVVEDKNNGLLDQEIALLKEQLLEEKGRFGDRHCDLTVIGDLSHVDIFADKLKSCFLTNDEIDLWNNGYEFRDPWPQKIVTLKKE